MWQTCAWYNLACAYLGQGRHAEALPLAKKAVAKNPLPDNTATFAVALERAKSKSPVLPAAPTVAPTTDEGLRSRWLDGDMRAVLEAALSADAKPELLLRAVRASRFRYDSENRVTSTPRMRETARSAHRKAPKISDYARLLHALARQPPLEALAAHDLDLASYGELASAWADALRLAPALSADLETALGSSFD